MTNATTGDMLREHVKSGQLLAEYPRVRELVAGLSGADLLRAGRLLAQLDPDEIVRAHPAMPVVTISITGHGTLTVLIPALTAQLARHGLILRPVLADFGKYMLDLPTPGSSLYTERPDLVLCVLDPAMVFDEVPSPWTPADVERIASDKLHFFEHVAERFAAGNQGSLVLNTVPLLRRHAGQLIDGRSRARLGKVWREFNAGLLELAARDGAPVEVVDLEPIAAAGVNVSDVRLSAYIRAHLSSELLMEYAGEIGHLARHLAGMTKKCLVVDLDGTLWGGVLGDDGIDGIEVGGSLRGAAFDAFQRAVRQISAQGILVAAVSKNDPELVNQVLCEHPQMTLRPADFVQVIANWQPKHENLRVLAETLGISTDGFVFADDSAYERGLVQRMLPGVTVIDLDNEPARHIEKLVYDDWFYVRELTSEDEKRSARYREEAVRSQWRAGFSSVEDYLQDLQVEVRLAPATEANVARLSQLTLRTNQFNLTTKRLDVQEVREFAEDPSALVVAIEAGDRFGDYGLVGAVFVRRDKDQFYLDNLVLSCRVFARAIEDACLVWLLRYARTVGAGAVLADYRPSPRNRQVADFYPRHGFVLKADDGVTQTFRHQVTDIEPLPEHVRIVESISGVAP